MRTHTNAQSRFLSFFFGLPRIRGLTRFNLKSDENASTSTRFSIRIDIYVYNPRLFTSIYIYIYMYTYREDARARERERERRWIKSNARQ
jgi:hypothetical protein